MQRAALALLALLVVTGARAQTLPTGADDLTLPPDMRQPQPGARPPGAVRKPQRPTVAAPSARRDQTVDAAPLKRKGPAPTEPVDFGVTVRGGSATSRFNSATGTSEAVQESGSSVGAGFRFGF